jgi:DNA repair protein RadD
LAESSRYAKLQEGFVAGAAAMSSSAVLDDCLAVLSDFLYDYQVDACRAAMSRILKTKDPLLLQLATGAGKSWVLVGLSYLIRRLVFNSTGRNKKVLMICPTPILTEQNHEKLIEVGFGASIYCDKLGLKETGEDIIVGTPVSLRNGLADFAGMEFAAVYVDECQHHTDVIKKIIAKLKQDNDNLRELGLTATPHRLDTGYIYAVDTYNNLPPLTEELSRNPYYKEKVYEIKADALIERGRLVPPVFAQLELGYETSNLKRSTAGKWTKKSEDAVFVDGKHQLTTNIVADIIGRSVDRRGVLIFAQNISHAEMLRGYFPKGEVGITHSKMDEDERDDNIRAFKKGKLKYLINVQSLTTGFDAPICDCIVFLRTTESPSLFEQMLGRGLRLAVMEGHVKDNCLVLDYAGNLALHAPDGDPFSPVVKAPGQGGGELGLMQTEVICPKCSHINVFGHVNLPDAVEGTEQGYMVWGETGEHLMSRGVNPQPLASHMGVRCTSYKVNEETKRNVRCDHVWSRNACNFCGHLNNARDTYCQRCHGPLNSAAESLLSQEAKRDSENADEVMFYGERFGTVLGVQWQIRKSRSGRDMLNLVLQVKESPYVMRKLIGGKDRQVAINPKPDTIRLWLSPYIKIESGKLQWERFCAFFFGATIRTFEQLDTTNVTRQLHHIVYRVTDASAGQSKFYEITDYFGTSID